MTQMNNETIEQKLTQYNEFFSIEHDFSVNILPLEPTKVTNFDQFLSLLLPF